MASKTWPGLLSSGPGNELPGPPKITSCQNGLNFPYRQEMSNLCIMNAREQDRRGRQIKVSFGQG
jgi:hypothetical protein